MYNLAKLLIEEPKKLERLILLLLKFLTVIYIATLLFGYKIELKYPSENIFPKNIDIIHLIYFSTALIIIWFVLWHLIAELFFFIIPSALLGPLFDKRKWFIEMLEIMQVVKADGNMLTPKKKIVSFTNSLDTIAEDQDWQELKTRIGQYYILAIVLYILFTCSPSIHYPSWAAWLFGFFIANMLISCIILDRIYDYIEENIESLQREFSQMSFSTRIANSIKDIAIIKRNYDLEQKTWRVFLTKKEDSKTYPDAVHIYPTFHWNSSLAKKAIEQSLLARKNEPNNRDRIKYILIISNILLDDKTIKLVEKQHNFGYIYIENDTDIHYRMEEFLFLLQSRNKKVIDESL